MATQTDYRAHFLEFSEAALARVNAAVAHLKKEIEADILKTRPPVKVNLAAEVKRIAANWNGG